MPNERWVENFVEELTRTHSIVDVETWADERRIIVHGKYADSGQRFVYEMPIVGTPRAHFSRSRSASRN